VSQETSRALERVIWPKFSPSKFLKTCPPMFIDEVHGKVSLSV
jgi:hypothetical protein